MVIINPVPLPPYGGRAYNHITPFTYRDGLTFVEVLEQLRAYIRDTVVPHVDVSFDALEEYIDAAVNETQEWTQDAIDALTMYVNDEVQSIIGSSITVQDPVVAGLLDDPESETRVKGDATYAAKSVQSIVETGRLSEQAVAQNLRESRGTVLDSDFESLEAALVNTPTGSTLEIRESWTRATPFIVNKSVTVEFVNDGAITLTDSEESVIIVTADDVSIINPKISGIGAVFATAKGISTDGGTMEIPLKNLQIIGGEIVDIPHHAILLSHVDGFTVSDCRIDNVGYSGIGTMSSKHGTIVRNRVSNIKQPAGFVNSYGIFASRDHTRSINTATPRSEDILIDNNTVENVEFWEGIDTHGGLNIVVTNNTVLNCRTSIAIVGSPATDGGGGYAALNFLVANNYIDTLKTDGSGYMGIVVAGAASTLGDPSEYATGMVLNNRVHNAGAQGTTNGALHFYGTRGVLCANNQVVNAGFAGIDIFHDNANMSVVGNTFTDVWADTASTSQVVNIRSSHNTVTFSGNRVIRADKVATHVNARGLNISSAGNNKAVDNGGNEWFNATDIPVVGGAINYESSAYGVSPVPKASAIASPAATVESLKTAVDALRLALKNYGITG